MSNEIKFDAGYDVTAEGDSVEMAYKDPNSFVDGSPISKEELKQLSNYQGEYSKAFLASAVDAAKNEFEKNSSVKNALVQASFGIHKSDKISAKINRDVKRIIPSFNGGQSKEITTVSVQVQYHHHSDIGKSHLKEVKQELHKSLYGEE